MKVRLGIICAWLMTLLCCTLTLAFADQADSGDDSADANAAVGQDQPTTRQDDDRLPAVLPGEEVVTQTGQKMKVWSSAGPVPVNQQPTQQPWGGGYGYGGPAVIVDGRPGFPGR